LHGSSSSYSSYAGTEFKREIRQQDVYAEDHFDGRLRNKELRNARIDGWVSVILELTRDIAIIWKRENELGGEFEESDDGGELQLKC
jgi:hypothetical protein